MLEHAYNQALRKLRDRDKIQVPGQPGIHSKTLTQKTNNSYKKKKKRAGGMAQAVEHLPSKNEALN
jgi:nucleoside-triphosphatase THEP1